MCFVGSCVKNSPGKDVHDNDGIGKLAGEMEDCRDFDTI